VTRETNQFKTQKADGVMGLSLSSTRKYFPTINKRMKSEGATQNDQFMLCLGKEGGSMTIGGYDQKALYDKDDIVQWHKSVSNTSYSIQLDKLYIGNVHIPHVPKIGFIDSGASWVYTSKEELEHIQQAFEQFCGSYEDKCIGKKVSPLCYKYDTTMNKSIRDFFLTYPTITFSTPDGSLLNWYPSEYFSLTDASFEF
jgi:hypothetical protein